MARDPVCLYSLPNEILVSILSGFETQTLLPLAIVSRRFHSVILGILHFRLLLAAALPDYTLILEAYHPSKRYSDPFLFCTYLGTDGLGSHHEGEGSLYEDCVGEEGRFAKLGALYSRFRPEQPGVRKSVPVRRFAHAVPTQATSANNGDGGYKKVAHTLNLDADELFGQFCAYASIVRVGPRRGLFLSNIDIVQPGQGVMRVWKQWLQDRAQELWQQEQTPGIGLDRTASTHWPTIGSDKNIMWTDYRKNVGLRVAVRDREGRCYGKDACEFADLPMSFSIEIEELVVRTTHIMLAVETSVYGQHSRPDQTYISWN